MTLDEAQDAYRQRPSRRSARDYVNELIDYYLDYQIDKDTFEKYMAEFATSLKADTPY